jgi:hypothetical protein
VGAKVIALRSAALITGDPAFDEDRAFDPAASPGYAGAASSGYTGAMMWMHLRSILAEHGIRLATLDVLEREGGDLRGLPFISQGWNEDARRCLERGGFPAVMFSWESPIVIWEVYGDLPRLGRIFHEILLLPGAVDRVPRSRFTPMLVPRHREPLSATPWAGRKYLVMVNSRHLPEPVSLLSLIAAVLARVFSPGRTARAGIRRQLVCMRDRELCRELYSERLRAIRSLSAFDDFDLYGRGWDRSDGRDRQIDLRRYRGEVDDKLGTMCGYRFALAIENASFPGYISEKIFDCFFAGCIPVYYGAPDIERYIPSRTFVDLRRFKSYRELDEHLRSITVPEAEEYRAAARSFLDSPLYEPFDHRHVARSIASAFLRSVI